MKRPFLTTLRLLLASLPLLLAAQPAAAQKVILQLPWHHQFQFAGYYMAQEKGYYAAADLEVDIRDVSVGPNPVEEVLSGRADFGVSGSGLVAERSLGKPVVAVAVIFQHSPSVFLSLESAGISKPVDFIGKKVMLSPGFQSLELIALLHQEKLFDKIERLGTSFDCTSLLNGQTDVFNAYRSNEPYQLQAQGYKVNIIDPQDYGLDFYGDTLFTVEGFVQKYPQVTEKFRQASLRGWEYAIAHPDEAITLIQSKYKCPKPVAALQYEATETIKLIAADQVAIGDMDLLRWGKINHYLIALGLASPDFYLSKDFLYTPPPGIPWAQLREWIVWIALGFILSIAAVVFLSKKNLQLKSVQKRLEEERAFSSGIIETAQMIILVLDKEGKIVSFNPYMERLCGYSLEEVKGLDWFDTFLPEKDHTAIREVFKRVVAERNIHGQVNPIIAKTGELFEIEWDNQILTDGNGEIFGVLAIGRDITEKKRREEVLCRYEYIISATEDHMAYIDHNYVYRAVNQAYLAAHSKTVAELVGHSIPDIMGTAVFEETIKEKIDRTLAGEVVRYQAWFDFAGKGRRYMDVAYSPHKDEADGLSGVAVSAHDITELKQLQDEQRQLFQAINQMSEAVVVTNLRGDIQYVNPAYEQITGYSAAEAIGQNPRILQSGQTDQAVFVELWQTLAAGNVWHGRFHNQKKDGSLYIEDATISPVFDSSGRTVNYIAVKRDVTREVELKEQLRQKFKMETVGAMAGGMAHNFNNNLAIILGNIDLARMRLSEHPDAVDSYLENARTAVLRARDLIQNILSYSRQGSHAKTAIKLADIIEETSTLLLATIPATVKLECVVDPENRNLSIHADASQLQEVLLNLCTNAVHAMAEAGELEISLEGVELLPGDISAHDDISPGCFAKVCVRDTGHGIPEEIRDKIFDPFFTTKAVGEGTGMGLSTVQGIVSQHGGVIRVKSQPGAGTTFELYFPIIERRSSPREDTAADEPFLSGGTEKILFVDDEELLVQVWDEILSQKGYRVTRMTSSLEALKLFTANPDFFDLVITDQTMPGLTGEALILEILKISPDIPIILCTGYSSKMSLERSLEIGAAGFCLKPLDQNKLLPLIRNVLDK